MKTATLGVDAHLSFRIDAHAKLEGFIVNTTVQLVHTALDGTVDGPIFRVLNVASRRHSVPPQPASCTQDHVT